MEEKNNLFSLERKFGLCPFLCSDEHGLRKCPKFFRFKRKCSPEDYYKDSPIENDLLGYCAAGVCVFVGNKYLFLKEMRDGKIKYNFPGGGRETVQTELLLRMENIYETAASEFAEEIGDLAEGGHNSSFITEVQKKIISLECKIIWCSRIKYALVLVQIDDKVASTLIPAKIVDKNAEAICFEWVDFNKKVRSRDFHSFVLPSIQKILDVQYLTTNKSHTKR
jgi:8-oxo-dGTP pyrophosphatase MutT (NUDIX family)